MTEKEFCSELLENLTGNILPYWIDKMVDPRGGFYGRRDGFDRLDEDAPKGAILNGRLLWSFASAYRATGKPEYLEMATRAKDYIIRHFSTMNMAASIGRLTLTARRLTPRSSFTLSALSYMD